MLSGVERQLDSTAGLTAFCNTVPTTDIWFLPSWRSPSANACRLHTKASTCSLFEVSEIILTVWMVRQMYAPINNQKTAKAVPTSLLILALIPISLKTTPDRRTNTITATARYVAVTRPVIATYPQSSSVAAKVTAGKIQEIIVRFYLAFLFFPYFKPVACPESQSVTDPPLQPGSWRPCGSQCRGWP